MATKSIFAVRRLSLNDVIQSKEFDAFRSDKLGNDLFISDPDRAERIAEAAEHGSDGSTHEEVIEDWREFLATLKLPESVRVRIEDEIDSCEEWHAEAGSLSEQLS